MGFGFWVLGLFGQCHDSTKVHDGMDWGYRFGIGGGDKANLVNQATQKD